LTACFKIVKALQPHQQRQTGNSFCTTCVYHSRNLDHSLYSAKGLGDLPDDGCSLDFIPGNEGCNEMKTSNCSVRKSR